MLAPALRFWHRVGSLGTAGRSRSEQRRIRVTNLAALMGAVVSLVYNIPFLIMDPRGLAADVAVNVLAALGYGLALAATSRGRPRQAAWLVVIVGNTQLLASSLLMGRGAGIQYFFFVFPAVAELLLPVMHVLLRSLALGSSAVGFVLAQYLATSRTGWLHVDPGLQTLLHPSSALATFAMTLIVVRQFHMDTERAEAQADAEHARSEQLLLNILPAAIAERLKDGQEGIADGIADCSVLFADIVGFTAMSARMRPDELVKLLNRVFTVFDELSERHGLEKIKTIGDAYMVASGLPDANPRHPQAIAVMALDMGAAVRGLGQGLDVRIGIHCGPVVAGVIGTRKFSYDVWGDTVNIASRMESHSLPGAIQVSAAMRARLVEGFDLELRGEIDVKGKGPMTTWWLRGEKTLTPS